MNKDDDLFVPDDPALYGPDPFQRRAQHSLRSIIGLTRNQFLLVVALSLLLFVFLGGPFWLASRETFAFRVFISYLAIPVIVLPLLWWNQRVSGPTLIAASATAAAMKFGITVIIDVGHGLLRHWPP